MGMAYTPHPCQTSAQHMCQGDNCGGTYSSSRYAGDCDPDGCDWNPFRMGNKNFYGAGKTVDTSKKFTVVTQFKGSGSSLSEIKQYYVQNGQKIYQPNSTWPTLEGYSTITDAFCKAQKVEFNDTDVFSQKGGLAQMGAALSKGMVLVLSLWDDVSFGKPPPRSKERDFNNYRISSLTNGLFPLNSTTPTCFGSTPPTRPMRTRRRPARVVVLARPRAVSLLMSKALLRKLFFFLFLINQYLCLLNSC